VARRTLDEKNTFPKAALMEVMVVEEVMSTLLGIASTGLYFI
jgi:hypothetical protein